MIMEHVKLVSLVCNSISKDYSLSESQEFKTISVDIMNALKMELIYLVGNFETIQINC